MYVLYIIIHIASLSFAPLSFLFRYLLNDSKIIIYCWFKTNEKYWGLLFNIELTEG